jgi:hypothetical protein
MAWVKFGSVCDQGWPFRQDKCPASPAPCPGSSVEVFENAADAFEKAATTLTETIDKIYFPEE